MAIKEALILGNPRLYEMSLPAASDEHYQMEAVVYDGRRFLCNFMRRGHV